MAEKSSRRITFRKNIRIRTLGKKSWWTHIGIYYQNGHPFRKIIRCLVSEADVFAESIFGDMKPSWHYGVRSEEEENTWKKFKSVAEICLPPEEAGKYIFGCRRTKK